MRNTLWLLIFLAVPTFGQISNQAIIPVTIAPSGSCTPAEPSQKVVSSGLIYVCQNVIGGVGTWGQVMGSGITTDGSGNLTANTITAAGPGIATALVTQSPYNASGFIAKTTLTATAAIGATSFSVASTTGFYPGDVVIIALGGTSGTKDYAGFIATASGTTLTINNTAVSGNLLPPTATSGTTGLTTSVPSGYQVYSVATTTVASSAVSGATSVTLTNASSYLQGQGLLLFGCGAAGANALETISAVSGNTLTITPGIANASGCASGSAAQHDDTAAFQAAINLVTPIQSAKILVPDGYYQINPPTLASSSGGFGSGFIVPCVPYYTSGTSNWNPQATLEITGLASAPQTQSYLATAVQPSLAGAIIKTSIAPGHASSLFGTAVCSASLDGFTNVKAILNNLTFRTYPDPALSVINFQSAESVGVSGVNFDTGDTGATTDPSGNTGGAFLGPLTNNGALNTISNVQVIGYFNGFNVAEHTTIEHARFDNVEYPIGIGSNTSNAYAFMGRDISFDGDPHGIVALTGLGSTVMNVDISMLNIEHQVSPAWAANSDECSDTTNLLHGNISLDVATSVEPFAPVLVGCTGILWSDAHFSGGGLSAAMTAGSVTITTPSACTPSLTCHYSLTRCVSGGTVGSLGIGTVTAGTSFVINSSSATDTSQVCWRIN